MPDQEARMRPIRLSLIATAGQPFADELPAFSGMQLVAQFSWAGRKYLIYERRE